MALNYLLAKQLYAKHGIITACRRCQRSVGKSNLMSIFISLSPRLFIWWSTTFPYSPYQQVLGDAEVALGVCSTLRVVDPPNIGNRQTDCACVRNSLDVVAACRRRCMIMSSLSWMYFFDNRNTSVTTSSCYAWWSTVDENFPLPNEHHGIGEHLNSGELVHCWHPACWIFSSDTDTAFETMLKCAKMTLRPTWISWNSHRRA